MKARGVDLFRALERRQSLLVLSQAVLGGAERVDEEAIVGLQPASFFKVGQGLAVLGSGAVGCLHDIPGEYIQVLRVLGVSLSRGQGLLADGRVEQGHCAQLL